MTQASTLTKEEGFGTTDRRDAWWTGPMLTIVGLSAFLIYGTWAAWQDGNFEIRADRGGWETFHKKGNQAVAPYLSPFYSPLIYDEQSTHAWIHGNLKPSWMPSWFPFSAGFLILAFPGLFRFTCYYYRKAYYRAFVADPFACGVGEPRRNFHGENRFPLILQNLHRYAMYFALIFLVLLTWDALQSFWWHTDWSENQTSGHFGIGVGSLIMVVNVIFLSAFTLGCNSVRHLVGGGRDCFTCPRNPEKLNPSYKLWRISTYFNEHHMEWAWLSLFSVGFVDVYVRMCSLGIWRDFRIL